MGKNKKNSNGLFLEKNPAKEVTAPPIPTKDIREEVKRTPQNAPKGGKNERK